MTRPDDGDLEDLRRDLGQRLQLDQSWIEAAAAPAGDPKLAVSSFGRVVERFFPDSVGALLQGYLRDSGGTVSTLARELGRDEDTCARLLMSLEKISGIPSSASIGKLAASHNLAERDLKSVLLRALARKAIRQGGARAQAARNKWEERKPGDQQ